MAANEQAVDPVCGMTITTDGAPSREHEGATYHFCSDFCANKFDEDAIAYIATSRLGLEGWADTSPPGMIGRNQTTPDQPRPEA